MELTKREMDVMRVLWEAKEPLIISEIVKRDKDGITIHSVHSVMHNLLKKGMVLVDGYEYSQRIPARRFRPAVNSESIEMTAMRELFNSLVNQNIPVSELIASFLPSIYDNDAMNELDKLEEMIKNRKKHIIDNQLQEHI